MKRSVSLLALLGLTMSLALISCNMGFGSSDNSKPESTIKGPANKGDTNSIVLNEVWEDENGDKWVNLTMNALNDIVQDSRTIIPDNPDLYFSVVASTDAWAANSKTSISTQTLDASFHAKLDGDAKCSIDVAGQDGKLVIDPYYALETNKMTGLTLTLKVGKAYYFTVYATNEKPTVISTSNFSGANITKDTIYSQEKTHEGQTANTAANYYANRADLIEHLANLAVVKGTAQFFISDNNGDVAIYEGAAVSDTPVTKIKIDASANDISGFGYALIPVDLEETTSLNSTGLQVKTLRFKWTPRTGTATTETGWCDINVDGSAKDMAIYPKISVGEYDTDLILLDGNDNDIFTIHDTLTVWKNQVSVLLGKSTYYQDGVSSWTTPYIGNSLPNSTTHIESAPQGSTETTPQTITAALANKLEGPVIGYKITANQIKNYFRTIFYVSGTGGDLPAETNTTAQNGSLFHPYSTVQAALNAITLASSKYSRANGYGDDETDWNIVIDGAPTAGDVSFNNTVDKQFNLTFRMFNDTRVTLADNITLTNESSKDFNVWLTNVDWDGAGKTFTAAANVLLTNSSLASDITTPAAGDGNVVLYKNSATKQDGIFYALTTDNSTVMNISNTDDAGKAVLEDAAVLRYDYFTPNTTYTTSPAVTYMTTDVLDKNTVTALEIFKRDPDSSGTAPVPKPRFAVSDAYRTGDAGVTDVSNPEIERVLDIDEEVGSDNYGCVIVKTKVNNIAVGFEQGVLRVYVKEWSPNTSDYASFTAAEVAAGTAAITVTLEVTSEDSDNYPSNSPDIVAVLDALGDGTGDGKLSTIMEGDQGTKAVEDTHYTVTYPSAVGTYTAPVAPSKKDSCTYTMTVTLDESLAYAVGYNVTGAENAPDEAEFRFYIRTSLGGSDFENPIGIKITKD